jgi:glycine/D-amino acid oxidase-like deaminating enzyme
MGVGFGAAEWLAAAVPQPATSAASSASPAPARVVNDTICPFRLFHLCCAGSGGRAYTPDTIRPHCVVRPIAACLLDIYWGRGAVLPREIHGEREHWLVDADVVVIGAGALGLSAALHCALAGRSVVVVERWTAGSQASGRAAGLFKSVQADELRTRLARRSIEKAVSFADWAGVPLEVARPGSFLIARTDQHREYLRRELAQSRSWGVDVREASPGQLADGVSYYRPGSGEFALWCPEDAYIEEPASLVQAYIDACRLRGAVVLENEPVTGITRTYGRVTGVETAGRSIAAPVVVDAAGGWVRQVAELAGARVQLAPVRHQLLITAPAPGVDAADPITRVVDAAVYLRPARGGLMVGGFEADPLPVDPRAEPASFSTDDVPLDLGVLRAMAAQVAAEVPAAESVPVAEHRGGMFTMSPDGRFVVGPVPDLPGLWVASGCNGSGFSSSPALGEALADWITSGEALGGVEELAPGRFGPLLPDDALVARGLWQYAHYYDPVSAAPDAVTPTGVPGRD